jgi:Domain of unknown function (DUF1996)
MITGNPFLRARDTKVNANSPEAYALTFRCWDSQNEFDPSNMSPPGGGNYDTIEFPQKKCNGGIRANIFFPSCWNGKDLDTPDHRVSFLRSCSYDNPLNCEADIEPCCVHARQCRQVDGYHPHGGNMPCIAPSSNPDDPL